MLRKKKLYNMFSMQNGKKIWYERFNSVVSNFTDVPSEEWEKVLGLHKLMYLGKNDFFLKAGDIPDKVAFIASGIFRVFFISESAEDKTLAFREEGRFLSAFNSSLENQRSWFSIQAMEEAVLLYISLNDYKKMLQGNICWQIINTKYMEEIYNEKEKREKELLSENAETRYRNLLERYPDIEKRIRQYHIASFLGISPVTLSRIRRGLKKN